MNWGKKILFLYLGFVSLILTLVFTCFGNKTELEYTDYYARELRFQDQIDARQNAAGLSEPILHQVTGSVLDVQIPQSLLTPDLQGNIELLRPSDSEKDLNVKLLPGTNGIQSLTVPENGAYRLRVSVSSEGKNYLHEAFVRFR